MNAVVVATSSYLPGAPIPNAGLTQFPAERIPLIQNKTGITARHYADAADCTSDLALEAARRCIAAAKVTAESLGAIIVATSTPDHLIPATAPTVQDKLGAKNACAFDINAVCSGAVYGLTVANSFIKSGQFEHVLLLAADTYSRFLNPTDFSTKPYFGDGAGAVLLSTPTRGAARGMLSSYLRSDGSGAPLIRIFSGGSRQPRPSGVAIEDFFRMDGKAVFEFAVSRGSEAVIQASKSAGLQPHEIDLLIPHQANLYICEEIARRCSIPLDRLFTNLQTCGNTAAASPLIALDHALARNLEGRKRICLVAFGGGLSYGAVVIEV